MPSKQPKKLNFRLPPYEAPRNAWRLLIHAAALEAQSKTGVYYKASDQLSVKVLLYMPDCQLSFHDVDNRLKDILDALQGRAGGSKAKRSLYAIIPNDNQVFRVEVEKTTPPKQSGGRGHVRIRRLKII